LLRSLFELGMIGKSKVIIRAEVQHFPAVNSNPRSLRRLNCPHLDQQSFPFQPFALIDYELQLIALPHDEPPGNLYHQFEIREQKAVSGKNGATAMGGFTPEDLTRRKRNTANR
jgi:hypothetical protein